MLKGTCDRGQGEANVITLYCCIASTRSPSPNLVVVLLDDDVDAIAGNDCVRAWVRQSRRNHHGEPRGAGSPPLNGRPFPVRGAGGESRRSANGRPCGAGERGNECMRLPALFFQRVECRRNCGFLWMCMVFYTCDGVCMPMRGCWPIRSCKVEYKLR